MLTASLLEAQTGAGGESARLGGPRVPVLCCVPLSDLVSLVSLSVKPGISSALLQGPGNRMPSHRDPARDISALGGHCSRHNCSQCGVRSTKRCLGCRGVSPSHSHHPGPLGDPLLRVSNDLLVVTSRFSRWALLLSPPEWASSLPISAHFPSPHPPSFSLPLPLPAPLS